MKERKLGLLGRKLGMTQVFDAQGRARGVTVVELGPCLVVGKRSAAADGFNALVLGFGARRGERATRPERGKLAKIGGDAMARRTLRELRVSEETLARFEVGQQVGIGELALEPGALVDVCGQSKGKGFQGVMKRHHFKGFRATHGTHEYFRHGGSIGCRKWPGRVFKGRKMAGHMGDVRVTTQNIEVVAVRPEDNVVLLHGSVPGAKRGIVTLRPAIKRHPLA